LVGGNTHRNTERERDASHKVRENTYKIAEKEEMTIE